MVVDINNSKEETKSYSFLDDTRKAKTKLERIRASERRIKSKENLTLSVSKLLNYLGNARNVAVKALVFSV